MWTILIRDSHRPYAEPLQGKFAVFATRFGRPLKGLSYRRYSVVALRANNVTLRYSVVALRANNVTLRYSVAALRANNVTLRYSVVALRANSSY